MNNAVSKLKARTRIHAIHKSHLRGFLQKISISRLNFVLIFCAIRRQKNDNMYIL